MIVLQWIANYIVIAVGYFLLFKLHNFMWKHWQPWRCFSKFATYFLSIAIATVSVIYLAVTNQPPLF